MSATDDAAANLLNRLGDGIGALANKLQALGTQYGPDAWQLVEGVARVQAVQNLVVGAVGAAIAFVSYKGSMKLGRLGFDAYESTNTQDDGFSCFICAVLVGLLGLAAGIFAVANLFDVWSWVGLFEPKLWIAHRIIEAATAGK